MKTNACHMLKIMLVLAVASTVAFGTVACGGPGGSGGSGSSSQETSDPIPPGPQKIVFQSLRMPPLQYSGGGEGIYIMNADGTGEAKLLYARAGIQGARDPSFSPDGTQIVFIVARSYPSERNIFLMTADRQNGWDGNIDLVQLTYGESASDPSFSPDGKKIVYSSDKDSNSGDEIYIMNADGTGRTRLTYNTENDRDPVFSPQGTKIAFTRVLVDPLAGHFGTATDEIFIMNADGTGQTRLTHSEKGHTSKNPSFSPDGATIVFCSGNYYKTWEIYIMNSDGTGRTKLTNNTKADLAPCFSPDGTQITFHSWARENDLSKKGWTPSEGDHDEEIFVMNVDGTGLTRLTHAGGSDPSFGPGHVGGSSYDPTTGYTTSSFRQADGSVLVTVTDSNGNVIDQWIRDRSVGGSSYDPTTGYTTSSYRQADGSVLVTVTDSNGNVIDQWSR